jgi:mxaA protein
MIFPTATPGARERRQTRARGWFANIVPVPAALALLTCTIFLGDVALARAQNSTPDSGVMPPPAAATATPPKATNSPNPARKSVPGTLAVVDQPRATGYFVGDKVTQRVLLENNGQAVSPVALPTAGRVSAWFERRSASVQTDASGTRWLTVEYQILNAPPKLFAVKLPAWSLAIKGSSDAPAAALRIPEGLINVAPLSLPGSPTQVGAADLRPDHLPPAIPTAPIRSAIEASAGALCLTLLAWLGWVVWRNRRALATQPFASALREMRALDDREPRAWQALHRAFDRTAGRVIQSATLPILFERAPQLIPAREDIEQFFTQSSLMFFGVTPPMTGARGPSPRALCVELRRIEKQHER